VIELLTRTLRRYWAVLAATAVLLPHALLFDFVNDDAYISFRYAKNLAEHGQLVFNLGERVEGFTNFLWTVLLAAGMKLGVSPVVSSRFFGLAFGIGTLAIAVRISLRLDGERPRPGHALAPLGLAATGAFACWCTGGLETQLFTFLVLLGFERTLAEIESGRGFASGAVFALASMTRPEGLMLFAIAMGFRLVRNLRLERRLRPLPHELAAALAFIALFFPYFVWRWRYFGWVFPNTFYVKSSGTGTLAHGLYYLRRFAEDYNVPFLGLLILAGWPERGDRARRDLFTLATLVVGAFALYAVKVGGDFMGLYRFILPALPLGALAAQEALRHLGRRLSPLVPRLALALALLAIAGSYAAASLKVSRTAAAGGSDQGVDSPGYLKHYVEERIPVGVWLGQQAEPDQLASVGGAGVIPYYSGLRSFDTFGLVDVTIAHDPRMTSSAFRPGHQKWVSDEYLFRRRPTIITHMYCLHERCAKDRDHWLRNGYEWVTATVPGLSEPPLYSFLKRIDVAFGPFPKAATAMTAP
jgi:arabinofuranosyltransferase